MIPQIIFSALLSYLAVSESLHNARLARNSRSAVAEAIGTFLRYSTIAGLAAWGGFYD